MGEQAGLSHSLVVEQLILFSLQRFRGFVAQWSFHGGHWLIIETVHMEAFPQGMFNDMLLISEMLKIHMSKFNQAALSLSCFFFPACVFNLVN